MTPQRPQPAIRAELPQQQERVRLGARDILEHIADNAEERLASARVTADEKKRLTRVASLARDLRKELTELAALEPKER